VKERAVFSILKDSSCLLKQVNDVVCFTLRARIRHIQHI